MKHWHFSRLLRLALGLAGLGTGIWQSDGLTILVGAAILMSAILNVSCCSSGSCSTDRCTPKPGAGNSANRG